MSNPNPPASAPRAPRWLLWIGLLAFVGYGCFIHYHYSNVAGGSDSSGYLNSARLLAEGKLQTELRAPPEFGPVEKLARVQFMPLGFWSFPDDPKLTPTYPTGLPLHFAIAGKLVDWITGPRLVGLFAALGAVWLCYAIGRELGLDARLAAAGAVALAACPVFLFTSFQPMSDTLAATWDLAAVWTALRARRHRAWAAACGTAFAVAVLVRPTNLVLLPTLAIVLGLDWRRLGLATLGGLPGVAWLAFYNNALYGGALQSGYGAWTETFKWGWGPVTSWHFVKWLAAMLPTPLLLLPVAAFTQSTTRTRSLLALSVWFVSIAGLYVFYEVSHEIWWCLRFIIPAIPALILAGLVGLEALIQRQSAERRDRFRAMAALGLTLWAVSVSIFWTQHFGVLNTKNGEKAYARACVAARETFPPGTLIATMDFSGAFYYYTDFAVLRWDLITPAEFTRYATLAQKAGRTVAAVEFDWMEPRMMREHCPGNWERVSVSDNTVLWRLVAPAPLSQNP